MAIQRYVNTYLRALAETRRYPFTGLTRSPEGRTVKKPFVDVRFAVSSCIVYRVSLVSIATSGVILSSGNTRRATQELKKNSVEKHATRLYKTSGIARFSKKPLPHQCLKKAISFSLPVETDNMRGI